MSDVDKEDDRTIHSFVQGQQPHEEIKDVADQEMSGEESYDSGDSFITAKIKQIPLKDFAELTAGKPSLYEALTVTGKYRFTKVVYTMFTICPAQFILPPYKQCSLTFMR